MWRFIIFFILDIALSVCLSVCISFYVFISTWVVNKRMYSSFNYWIDVSISCYIKHSIKNTSWFTVLPQTYYFYKNKNKNFHRGVQPVSKPSLLGIGRSSSSPTVPPRGRNTVPPALKSHFSHWQYVEHYFHKRLYCMCRRIGRNLFNHGVLSDVWFTGSASSY